MDPSPSGMTPEMTWKDFGLSTAHKAFVSALRQEVLMASMLM